VLSRFASAASAGLTHLEDVARSFGEHSGQYDPLAHHHPVTALHNGHSFWFDILSFLDAPSLSAASASAPFMQRLVRAHEDALWAQLVFAEFPSIRYACLHFTQRCSYQHSNSNTC
jgi:hypothetical protein